MLLVRIPLDLSTTKCYGKIANAKTNSAQPITACSLTTFSRADAGAWFNYPFLTSKERDNETGLDYAKARYHSSGQGRFTGTDPYLPMADADKEEFFKRYLNQPQNWNRYAYCINNPLIFIDPNGLGWYVKKGDAVGHPEWFDDDKEVDMEVYEGVQAFVYRNVENGKFSALNPFKNEGQDFDTSDEAMAMYQGYIVNEALADMVPLIILVPRVVS
jgi:RHS repeat-associated protein